MGFYSMISLPQWYLEGRKWYGKEGYERCKATWPAETLNPKELDKKTFIVTGGNAGIGYSMASQLACRGGEVHILCRNKTRGEEARDQIIKESKNPQVFLHLVDLSLKSNILSFAKEFKVKHPHLHGIIHNAGVMLEKETITSEGLEATMATAYGGTFLLVGLLLEPLQKASGRVVNVSSGGMYTVGLEPNDLNGTSHGGKYYDGSVSYALAKRGQVALTERWAEEYPVEKYGIEFYAMHPGWVDTPGVRTAMPGFYKNHGEMFRNLDQGADTAVWLLRANECKGKSGTFWFDRHLARTHMPLAWTKYSKENLTTLWENCKSF